MKLRQLGRSQQGLTLMEVLVALLLWSVVSLGLVETIAAAQQARLICSNRARAIELAAERMERIRAGDTSSDPLPLGIFTRTWTAQPALAYARFNRVDVTITWDDTQHREYTLSTLMREAS